MALFGYLLDEFSHAICQQNFVHAVSVLFYSHDLFVEIIEYKSHVMGPAQVAVGFLDLLGDLPAGSQPFKIQVTVVINHRVIKVKHK